MNDEVMSRLNTINWWHKSRGWIAQIDATWLRNWLGKDGDPKQLLDEAIQQKQLELITERLTSGDSKTIQSSNFLAAAFRS